MGIDYRYFCRRKQTSGDVWGEMEGVSLNGVIHGEKAPMQTEVKACWDDKHLYFRFLCEDRYIVASMSERDDPIYEEDVVEIFIDEAGDGRNYMEFEFSPANVIFDARIKNDLNGTISVDTSWNVEDMTLAIDRADQEHIIYDIVIPHRIFEGKPTHGREFRINFYRIDQTPDGNRHYMSWSPTGKVNYHVPQRFGTLVFV